MRTQTPRLDVRWMAAGRSKVDHDHVLLGAFGCVAAAALLYLMFALLVDVDEDATLGAAERDVAIVARTV